MLTITRYLDISPRIAAERLAEATVSTPAPADSQVRVGGIDELATVEIVVPWSTERREATALAADRYATALVASLAA
ncbi:MAG: hypothetical protein AAGA90_18965 [Actinomycetota bacterium]